MIGYLIVGILGAWAFGIGLLEANPALIILGGILSAVMAACIYAEQKPDSTESIAESDN